jgi:hypothetical protein
MHANQTHLRSGLYNKDSCVRYAEGGVKRKQKLKLNASDTEIGNF